MKRYHAYAQVSEAEYALIVAQAKAEGLTIADFVRRCINAALLEQGDDVPLLTEKGAMRATSPCADNNHQNRSQEFA